MNPVDIGSLLRLLKTLLTPEQYRQLMIIIEELIENPRSADVTVWGAHLLAWIRLHYPQLEGLMQGIVDRLAASAAAAEAEAAAALMIEIAAILALIAITVGAIYITVDEVTTPLLTIAGGKPCNTNNPAAAAMARVQRSVTIYAWGQRRAINKAIEAAQALCDVNKAACAGGNCGSGKSCKPSVAILGISTKSYLVTTGATVTFVCPCTCQ